MPGFGGGGMPAGAAAQAAQAAMARLQAMLPPGVSLAQAGVAMLLLLYVAPRVLASHSRSSSVAVAQPRSCTSPRAAAAAREAWRMGCGEACRVRLRRPRRRPGSA